MPLTFQEKFNQMKLDRSLAVGSNTAIIQARLDVKEEDDFNNQFLHGDGTYVGINDLIWYWLYERGLEGGDFYLRPVLDDSLLHWRDDYNTMMEYAADERGEAAPPEREWWQRSIPDERYLNGFYPPDADGSPSKELNWTTDYLNDNGAVRPGDSTWGYPEKGDSSGFLFHLYGLKTTVGSNPTNFPWSVGDSIVSTFRYATSGAAQDAAKMYLYGVSTGCGEQIGTAMTGTGLIGRRRADVDIDIQFDTKYRYVIGDGDSNEPNFFADEDGDINNSLFNDNYKTNFTTKLLNVCTFGDSDSTYVAHLNALSAELAFIEAGTNTIFADPDMASEIGDSELNITTLVGDMSRLIGNTGDTWDTDINNGDSSLWGIYNFLTGGSPPSGSEAGFSDALDLAKFLNDSLITLIEDRYTTLNNGIVIGAETTVDDGEGGFDGARKWRAFWIKARIGKPKGTLLAWKGLEESVTDAILEVGNKNQQLQNILGDTTWDHYQYIPTPIMLASFFDPKLNQDTGAIITKRIAAIFDGQQHASKYFIYRQEYDVASSTSISNDRWGDTSYYDVLMSKNPETGFVLNEYTDFGKVEYDGDSVQNDYQELFLYRHQLFSTKNLIGDTNDSVVLEPLFFEFENNGVSPVGSGDTIYYNSNRKPWAGIGDSKEVTSFWSETTNLINYSESLGDSNSQGVSSGDTDKWYFVNSGDSAIPSNYYFDEKQFTEIIVSNTDGDIRQKMFAGSFGNTLGKAWSVTLMEGRHESWLYGDTTAIYFTNSALSFVGNYNIYWDSQTVATLVGDTSQTVAEWLGDSIVRISGVTIPLADAGDTHIFIIKPNKGDTGTVYATAVQVEDNNYVRPYVNGTRPGTSLGYTYNWGDSGAIECYFYPRFHWNESVNKWIWADYSGSSFNFGLYYSISVDKFRYQVRNVAGGNVIDLYCGIANGDSGDIAFTGDTYFQQWHHIKAVWSFPGDSIDYGDTKIFKLFYNGNFIGGDSTGDSVSINSVLNIGGIPLYDSPANFEFNGEITDFMIWDYGDSSSTHYDNQVPFFHPDPFPIGTNYVYRSQTIDINNTVGGDITKSLQSNLFDSTSPTAFTALTGDSVLQLGDSHDYSKREYVVLDGTSNSNGYYLLTRTEDTSIFISPTLGADTSGTVYPTNSVVFIQE